MSEPGKPAHEELVLALHAEEATVALRKVDRGGVRVQVQTQARELLVDEVLTHERVEITRVPMDRMVESAPPDRIEGDTTIISVVEEVVVVERRLIVKEEIHLRRIRITEPHHETVVLREQSAVIERIAPDHAGPDQVNASVVNHSPPSTALVSAEASPPTEAPPPLTHQTK